jgi:YbbR domain-containing protein
MFKKLCPFVVFFLIIVVLFLFINNNAKTNHQQTGKPRTFTHAGVNQKLFCTFYKNSEHHIGQCGNILELDGSD